MKTPDEIKKGMEFCFNSAPCSKCKYDKRDFPECIRRMYADALALIQQFEAQVPKWISVEERLPEDDVAVLVYAIGNNENSCVAMTSYTHHMYGYNIEGWRSPWQYFFYERKITHWMPLPSTEGLHDD